ncbi:MAG: hypothetical protein ACJZ49_07180 [Candidatus Thalassarchaeaceae archaeon]|nr:MAG: hypothetical protein CBC45_000865 [Euryarchaeota archaeon TMED85]
MESGNEDSSIESPWDLVKILLSPKTIPHVFLLICGTGVLFALISTINNDPGYAAIIFTSAMISYIFLGIIGNKSSINKWLLADRYSSFLTRLLGPLILPLLLMSIISTIILLTIAGDKNIRDLWAVSLASLFVLWSIGQGLALKTSIRDLVLRSKSSKKSEIKTPTSWDFQRLILGAFIFTAIIGVFRGIIVTNFIGTDSDLVSWMIYYIVCFSLIAIFLQIAKDGIVPLDTSWTKGDRNRVHRTGQLLILLIAWHLSSAWSRLFENGNSAMLFEEIILVIITVVSAVWAMSNRNRSSINFISKDTAILWAIAFGFGYAGSITVMSGLTESLPILGDVSQTLGVGHVLTAITLLMGFKGSISRPIEFNSEEE